MLYIYLQEKQKRQFLFFSGFNCKRKVKIIMPIEAIKAFCSTNSICPLKTLFKNVADVKANTAVSGLNSDVFISEAKTLRKKLIDIRQEYLKNDPELFLTLDHIKSNYDNWYTVRSMEKQTEDLGAVSTDDFCNLSEALEQIRTPQRMTAYRAMEGNDFQIGRIMPEEFFEKYYQEGKIVTVPIYMHSTLDKNVAYRFAQNNPYRFIIKMDIPENTPAVYMEELTPEDVYDNEDEIVVTKNSFVQLGKLTKSINPLTNEPIYEIEGKIVGHQYVRPAPQKTYNFEEDSEYQELAKALGNRE